MVVKKFLLCGMSILICLVSVCIVLDFINLSHYYGIHGEYC